MRIKTYIKIQDCKEGYVYYISARNASVGIFHAHSFTISRTKFHDTFLFEEDHWDTGAPFGTVMPITEIMQAPVFVDNKEKLEWLTKFEIEYSRKHPCPDCGKFGIAEPLKCECQTQDQNNLKRSILEEEGNAGK